MQGNNEEAAAGGNKALVEAENLTKRFPVKMGAFRKKQLLTAVNDVTFKVYENETFGIVGESGCGKSTTGRLLLQLLEPTSGNVIFNGKNLGKISREELRQMRSQMQFIFQDPYASMDPRHSILSIVGESLVIFGSVKTKEEKRERVAGLLEDVGLGADAMSKYPHEFSGGQRQRICIARALAINPKFIVADEPVSALDVSIQAQVINLLMELKKKLSFAYLFISHDLSVVKYVCDRVAVMYLGRIVELAPKEDLFESPMHPYTQALLRAVPKIGKSERTKILTGEVPSPLKPPDGCVFHPRCSHAKKECRFMAPPLKTLDKRSVSCWLYE